MSEHNSPGLVSRRTLLGGGAAAAAAATGLALTSRASHAIGAIAPEAASIANVRVDHDHFGTHVGPTLAANPRHPRHLFTACQTARAALGNPEFMTTFLSLDAGATWQSGGIPKAPAGKGSAGDDVNVTFDPHGRGYVVATATGSSNADRAMYAWRTDDGGRSFSAPVTMVSGGQYFDAPWIAAGNGQTPSDRNVYVVWASNQNEGGDSVTMRRSTDGGLSFGSPRVILNARTSAETSISPKIAAGANGLVCVVGNAKGHYNSAGDMIARVTVVCSTDAGHSFAAPVDLGWESVDMSLPGDVIPNSDAKVATSPQGDALYVAFVQRLRQDQPLTDLGPGLIQPRQDLVQGSGRDSQRRRDLFPAVPGRRRVWPGRDLRVRPLPRPHQRSPAPVTAAQTQLRPAPARDHSCLQPDRQDADRHQTRRLVDRRLAGHRRQRRGHPSRVERHPHREA